MAYEYDVFLSYPNEGNAAEWVENIFRPRLQKCLDDELQHPGRIFYAPRMPSGAAWPEALQHALRHSKLLLAVWTPPYFRSEWCLAEWHTMLRREELLQLDQATSRGLVYPVVYSDGRHFHSRAQATQHRKDLQQFTCPTVSFIGTGLYVAFFETMRQVAREIAEHLDTVPGWQPDWPVVIPPPSGPGRSQQLPVL